MSFVHTSGPIFDGRAEEAARKGTEAIAQKLAEVARDKAKDIQFAKIHVQSHGGAEPASLHVVSYGAYNKMVTDNHTIVYGPWLEGTGSRNRSTRFRGYHALRTATSEVNAEAERIGNEEIKPFVAEMN